MKVTFPHMGHLYITAKTIFEGLGLEVIVPPKCSRKTLDLGARYAPEFACLPLKINCGNFLEARELGADTIVMAGGVGPCRFGYYAQIQREILNDIGQSMEMIVLEPPNAHFSEVLDKIRYLSRKPWQEALKAVLLAWQKTVAVDKLEQKIQWFRPREVIPGKADQLFKNALEAIEAAVTKKEVLHICGKAENELHSLKIDENFPVLRIAIVGEIYTVLEPFVNQDLEKHLGRMGVEVHRSIYLSQWINDHLLGGILPMSGAKKAKKMAKPYLNYFVGGHGRETIGSTVEYAKMGFDGVIQLAPMTCMPEIVAESILPAVSKDFRIPVMTLYLDEQSGQAGIITRLEAFVDMIFRSKNSRKEGEKCKLI